MMAAKQSGGLLLTWLDIENMTHFHKLFAECYTKSPKHYRDST